RKKIKSVFARHGIPKEIVSDHVPFASYEMKSFANPWEIKLTYSSPGFPSSNGMAERPIKTVKHALKKAIQTGTGLHLVLLSLRNTPVTGLNLSPAQMLMERVLRSTLPCTSHVLKQSTLRNILDKVREMQTKQKLHFDQHARPLPVDTVNMQTQCSWKPAVIVHQREEPRSYTVRTSGDTLRRNRRHLRKIHPSLFKDIESFSENMDNTAFYHTRSGRGVRRPARYRD
uniref:Integrase catalytic domain-containing protein n=1 Tax=Oryzias melastigma TaxID=30732 RepID=A0A3B3BSF9_ORYME